MRRGKEKRERKEGKQATRNKSSKTVDVMKLDMYTKRNREMGANLIAYIDQV